MPLDSTLIGPVDEGIKSTHVEKSTQRRARKPLAWGILTRMQGIVPSWEWGKGWCGYFNVVLWSYVAGFGTVRGGERESSVVSIFCGGGMSRFSEFTTSWGMAGGSRRTR